MGGALLLYLAGFAPFRQALQRVLGMEPAPGGNAAPAGNPPGAPAAPAPAPGGILHELHALLVGFFTSLLPGEAGCACLQACKLPRVRTSERISGVNGVQGILLIQQTFHDDS